MIRNPKTKMSIAIKSLQAERRWASFGLLFAYGQTFNCHFGQVVSGTPIINSPRVNLL